MSDWPVATSGGGGGMAKLFDSVLGVDTAGIDTGAGGVAGGYLALQVLVYARTADTGVGASVYFTINNDTGSNYDYQYVRVINSGTPAGFANNGQPYWEAYVAGNGATAATFGAVRMSIPAYADTTGRKAAEWTCGYAGTASTQASTALFTGGWRNTAAITRLKVDGGGLNLKAGTRMTIWGLS